MNRGVNRAWFTLLLICVLPACNGQMKNNNPHNTFPDRPPAVAGSFYPAQPKLLEAMLKDAFSKAEPKKSKSTVTAIISPHAGYIYSAKVAASAFNQIDPTKKYEHIFVIGSSHRTSFNGASVYTSGNFITPLGSIPIDPIAESIIENNPVFTNDIKPHIEEHSLEVQLPFLQYHLKNKFSIVPILLGTQSPETCKKIALALKPYFNSNNLFVISSDFSHYPNYDGAIKSDSMMAEAIESNSPQQVLKTIAKLEKENIPNLLTSMCGWTSVLTLLNMSANNPNINIRKVDYQNSGDIISGDKTRVVGYVALAIEQTKENTPITNFILEEADKKALLKIARNTITQLVNNKQRLELNTNELSANLLQKAGAFVTLQKKGELRGCIGTFKPTGKLYNTIQEMVISAATHDYRFTPVQPDELSDIEIEISVLTPLNKINSINDIILGKHGIYIVKGLNTGTLLPQVPEKYGWSVEEFLGYCARDKAGIGWNGWKDAYIYTYEAIIFSEKELINH
jgi:AmmeMemoRadiSam system protein B/AmmeMemoRadiSam system protein A